MNVYRLLTGSDDASFCHKVSEALNKGWSLYGSPSLTFDPEQKRVIVAQAIVKEVFGGRDFLGLTVTVHSIPLEGPPRSPTGNRPTIKCAATVTIG